MSPRRGHEEALTQRVTTDVQRHNRQIHNADVGSIINLKPHINSREQRNRSGFQADLESRVDDTAIALWQHGARTDGV